MTEKITKLPKGYISKKAIKGRVYYYHQWSENGTKQSQYLKDDVVENIAEDYTPKMDM